MGLIKAESGQYFFVKLESGAQVYKVVAWSENESEGLDPLCNMVAMFDINSGEPQWELHSSSASSYRYSNAERPFLHFVTYFKCDSGRHDLYRSINEIAREWDLPEIII